MELSKYQNSPQQFEVSGQNIVPYILSLSEYMQSRDINVMPYPTLIFSRDDEYATNPFGKTAYYDPERQEIVLYTAGRHIKDVLRSFAHEMIHHNQNLSGALDSGDMGSLEDPNYAQNNKYLRKMEMDAYLRGNMAFRDWESGMK